MSNPLADEARARVLAHLERRRKDRSADQEVVHSYDVGGSNGDGIQLVVADLAAMADALDAATGEPGDHAELVARLMAPPHRRGYETQDEANIRRQKDREEAAEALTAETQRRKRAEEELHTMKTAGVIEVAVRNPSISDYMQHWEARAEAAEAERDEHRRNWERAFNANTALEAQNAALTARVEGLTGAAKRVLAPLDEPCRHDHHGYCQTHFVEAECSVAALRAALSATTEASHE